MALSATALLMSVAAGCGSPLPRAAELAPFADDDADLERLERGRAEYIAKCSGCHSLYVPTRGSAAYWTEWTHKMAKRSHIEPVQSARIVRYLTAAGDAQRAAELDVRAGK